MSSSVSSLAARCSPRRAARNPPGTSRVRCRTVGRGGCYRSYDDRNVTLCLSLKSDGDVEVVMRKENARELLEALKKAVK